MTTQAVFLVLLTIASVGFLVGAGYFLHLPQGLKGGERAATIDRNAFSNRKVALLLVGTLAVVAIGWLLMAQIVR